MDIGYSITGNETIDNLLGVLADGSEQDSRFKINVGDYVYVELAAGGSKRGTIAQVRGRRNGYPPPHFNCWFPLLYLEHIDGTEGGGEIGEQCVRLATEEEISDAGRQKGTSE